MPFPPPISWQIDMPSWVSLQPVRQDSNLIVRVGNELRAIDLATGTEHWNTVVDPAGGIGGFLAGYGDLVLTDRDPDPENLTQVVGVCDGQIVFRSDLRCRVPHGAAVAARGMLFMVGNDPATGDVLAGVDLASGQVKVDVPLASGAHALALMGDRLIIMNRMGSPGLYSVNLDGSDQEPIERLQAYNMRISAGRLLAILGDEHSESLQIQTHDLETLRELWTAQVYGPGCGLDGDVAVHTEEADGEWTLALREAHTGKIRWRGEPQTGEMPGSIQFAADFVFVTQTIGMTAYRRDNGQLVGHIELGRIAQLHDDRLYLGGFRTLMCTQAG